MDLADVWPGGSRRGETVDDLWPWQKPEMVWWALCFAETGGGTKGMNLSPGATRQNWLPCLLVVASVERRRQLIKQIR